MAVKAKAAKKAQYTVHVISGTHWDREWRFTAEQSKLRLADLVDMVMDTLEGDAAYRHYVLDGGTVILEDYLSIRPESRERLERLIRAGRISLANWYTLPGINLVSPEALIRNLLIGRRVGRELGGTMKAGYTACGYGQPAQMPQIFRGFGIDNAMFYRGTNKHQVPPISRWRGPDGSEVMLVRGFDEVTRTNWFFFAYMPLAMGKSGVPREETDHPYDAADLPVHMADEDLYETGFHGLGGELTFPRGKKALLKGYQHFRDQAYPVAVGRHVLGLDMEDNATPWPGQPKLIEALNKVLDDTRIVHSSLDEYMAAVSARGAKAPVLEGELRFEGIEYGWNGLYGMTSSARVRMKLLNERAETGLILVAEPLAGIHAALGGEYPRQSLHQAWLSLLKNHSHDSICGAGIDEVHEDMAYRFRQVRTVAEEVGKRAVEGVWRRIDHSRYDPADQTLTVFNPAGIRRRGVRKFVLDLPVSDFQDPDHQRSPTGFPDPFLFDILDESGKAVDYEVIDVQDISIGYESETETAGASMNVKRHRVLLEVDSPPMGYRSFAIRKRAPRYVLDPRPGPERGLIAQPGGVLENRHLRVEIQPDGTFHLVDKVHKRTYRDLHSFEDRIATGSWPHMDAPALRDEAVTSLGQAATITRTEANPLRGGYRIELKLPVPKEAIGDWYRSSDRVEMPITVDLSLSRDARRVEIRTVVDNRARDHRLLVMLPTGLKTDEIDVEAAFAVERRSVMFEAIGDNTEAHHAYQPMQNFVDMSDGRAGLAILNQGMREYAAWDDPDRTVSLTLFRTYRVYMTANTKLTPEETAKYPGTNTPGKMEFHYAVHPHAGDWRRGDVMREAYDFKTPVRAIQGPAKAGDLPPTHSFLKIEPEGKVMMSAFYRSVEAGGTILRVWNTGDEPVEAKVSTKLGFTSAGKVAMSEEGEGEGLPMRRGTFTVPLRGAEIATILLRGEAGDES